MFSASCCKESHDSQRIKYLCIDRNCIFQEKLGCADCFLDFHPMHKKISTSDFLQMASNKLMEIKKAQNESSSVNQQQLLNSIDDQFDLCSQWILAKFNSLKVDLKSLIDADIENLQFENKSMFDQINKQVNSIKNLPQVKVHEMTQQDLEQLVQFNKKSDQLLNSYSDKIQNLNEQKTKMKQKKQKYLRKMNAVVNTLLREFKFNMTPEKSCEYIVNSSPSIKQLLFTPVKGLEKTQKQQADVTAQLLEMSRSKKKFGNFNSDSHQQSTQKKTKTQ